MRVSHKLILLPLVALGGILAITVLLMRNTVAVYESANYGNVHAVPSLLVLNKLKSHFLDVRVLVWQHVGAQDTGLMKEIEQKIAGHRAGEEEALREYEPFVFDAKDRELLAMDQAAIVEYDSVKDEGLALSRAGRKAEAAEFFLAQKARLGKLGDALSAHIKYNASLAEQASANASHKQHRAFATGIGLAILTLAGVGVLGFWIFRSLMQQLGGEPADVADVAAKVAGGDLTSRIVLRDGDDESLFAAVARMQSTLAERADRDRQRASAERERADVERAVAVENARIRTALDGVSVGVMLADNDGRIIYANEFCTELFRRNAAEIRKQIPGFEADGIIGTSFDRFHRQPSHQKNLLARLSQPHASQITLGAATLRVVANPVVDATGTRLGTVVQWIDRSLDRRMEDELKAAVDRALQGDLTGRLRDEEFSGYFQGLARGINALLRNVGELMRAISQAAGEVRSGADEISRGNLDLSQRTEEQASSLEQTASSMEEMTARVKNSADNAAQANQLAVAAREQAEKGGVVVTAAVAAMREINVSSNKISDIIGVIDSIAFQTNLLALNAAVEAARAGEQGRGFAVVASEVRNLASRSADAAKQVKMLIQDSVTKVADGSHLVEETGRSLAEIVVGVKKVTDTMAEIAASSQEQAVGIEQVNKALNAMDSVTQQNAALVEQASAAAHVLNDQAAQLADRLQRYRWDDDAAAGLGAAPVRDRSAA